MTISASTNPIAIDVEKGVCKIDKVDYPIVGLGTYPSTGEVCREAVEKAVQNGYRIIDTATYYRNFDAIAEALKNQDRSLFYIISKVWHTDQAPEELRADLKQTLQQLHTDYLDAYLLHWPNSAIPIEKTLGAMDELRKAKKIRHLGLSNVSVNHLKRALEVGTALTWVQIEMHPHFFDVELDDFCRAHGIHVQAWGPLGRGRLADDPFLTKIGQRQGKTAAQVALRWIIQHGCVPLPGSKKEGHIRENAAVQDFTLSPEEMEAIDQKAKKGKRGRYTKEVLGISDEFDFSYEQCWPRK